ncbi:MAG: AAA family ATPase [Chloroflexi bacterium]|nr:AAA family ATPase [Chloroflexota bacterium]
MPELDYITVRGFRSIAEIDKLKLGKVNVLIGPNGSGKSNFIEVFAFLHAIREGQLQDYVAKAGGAGRLLHFGARHTRELYVHISFNDEVNQYEIALEPTELDQLIPITERVMFWDKPRYDRPFADRLDRRGLEAGISAREPGISSYVRNHLGSWRRYHFHDTGSGSGMKTAAAVNDNRFLRTDGSNLPSFLYYLREQHSDSYRLITEVVRQAAPFLRDFRLGPQRLSPDTIRLEWRHQGSDAYFDATALSDGTLRFIALATLFLQPQVHRPAVILVDEPELGLHPYAIVLLGSLMKQVADQTQVVVSTQSPLLLDQFEPEDILVADQVDGATQLSRLNTDTLVSWLDDYSLGQLWEKNELGGRPRW